LSFPTLPSDIHHLILTDYLPYDSIVALRSTSSHFHSLIPPSTLKRLRQNVIANLLADERTLLQKWLPQAYGRYGRPAPYMTCYSCLQSLPTTDFFAYQVSSSRGLGRKRASERWCKPCGLKYGKIRQGKWIAEVSYCIDEQIRYETVMGEKLEVPNPCIVCPPKQRYDGQHVWWGCVDCFEKEEKRLKKQDSERRRDIRRHCSKVKRGIKACVHPGNVGEFSQEMWWRMRANVGYRALVRKGWSMYWWVKDESLITKAGRTCGKIGRVLDPRNMQEPGQKLGRKAKRAVGAVIDLATKNKKDEVRSGASGIETSTTLLEDCIVCCPDAGHPPALQASASSSSSSPNHNHNHNHNHVHIPLPHREVRCWRCWRAKRSRRRRRYDDGMAYGIPLPKERWCAGCQAEHDRFVAMKRERKVKELDWTNGRRAEVEEEDDDKKRARSENVGRAKGTGVEADDVGLSGLFREG
jgi:hypothetical protein